MKGLTFNGRHSSELNLILGKPRRPLLPENRDTYIDVPFRNGSILAPDNSKKDIEVECPFTLEVPSNSTMYDEARKIARWLSTENRVPLIFDDDPNYYYNAKVISNIILDELEEFEEYLADFTVVFRCEPEMKAVGT